MAARVNPRKPWLNYVNVNEAVRAISDEELIQMIKDFEVEVEKVH